MKNVGLIIGSLATALLLYFLYRSFMSSSELISPVPDGKGVKVIYISPAQSR